MAKAALVDALAAAHALPAPGAGPLVPLPAAGSASGAAAGTAGSGAAESGAGSGAAGSGVMLGDVTLPCAAGRVVVSHAQDAYRTRAQARAPLEASRHVAAAAAAACSARYVLVPQILTSSTPPVPSVLRGWRGRLSEASHCVSVHGRVTAMALVERGGLGDVLVVGHQDGTLAAHAWPLKG